MGVLADDSRMGGPSFFSQLRRPVNLEVPEDDPEDQPEEDRAGDDGSVSGPAEDRTLL